MKIEDKKFDFKFLNFMMYFGFAVAIYFLLKNIGVMDKIVESIVALTPVFLGIILCWISTPLTNKLRKIGLSKNLSAILSLILIFGLIIAVFSVVVPMFVSQFSNLVKEFPSIYDTIVDKLNPFLTENLNIEANIKHFNEIISKDIILDNLDNILTYSISTLQSVFSVLVTIGTTIVVSFFMVKNIDKFKEKIIMFFSRNGKGGKTYKMLSEIDAAVMSYVKGTILDSIIVGILTTIVCLILGLDYAIVLNNELVMLIEAKAINEHLEKHDSELFRYFGTSKAKFAILTNGIEYKFYTDLEKANVMDNTPFLDINLNKAIMMLVLHEIEEIKIGDLTPFDKISKEEKRRLGKIAVEEVLKDLSKSEEYIELIEEFEEMKTKESKFAKMIDKLESDIQSKIYCEEGSIDASDIKNQKLLEDDRINKLIQQGEKTIADFFIENDRPIFKEKIINDIASFVKKNELLKLKSE